ncbi:MAG: MFS transporter, partial [Actinobacteria bacterium]|nr:MFS transporter [Actinomycetota bacterium]
VDTFAGGGMGIMAPEISAALGLTPGQFTQVFVLSVTAGVFAPALTARLVQDRPRRALLSLLMAIGWSIATISLGFVVSAVGLILVLALNAYTTTSIAALHFPLLFDSYPPEVRIRGASYYQSADAAGTILAPLSIGLLAGVLGYTWRGVFVITGVFTFVCVLLCLRLRDPGFGRWDTEAIRATAREEPADGASGSIEEVELGFMETMRRMFLIPTVRRFLIGFMIYGMAFLPYITFFNFFLEQRWGLGPGARALFALGGGGLSMLTLVLFGKRGDSIYREDPAKAMEFPALCLLGTGGFTFAAVLAPWFWLMVALSVGAIVLRTPIQAMGYATVLSVVPSSARSHFGVDCSELRCWAASRPGSASPLP